MKVQTRIIIGVAIIILLLGGGLFLTYKNQIRQAIQSIALEMKTTPYSWLVMIFILILTSIPPLLGFTFTATLTGFIYGVPNGFPIVITGAFFGAMICFYLIRRYNFAKYIKLSTSKQEKYHAIQEAIEQGGFKIMLLIRLSPIPWPFTNMLLSLLPTVTTKQFTLTALVSSFKLCLEVWVGSQLADISNPDLPPSAHRVAVFTMLGSVLILVIVAWWLYRLSMQKVKYINSKNKKYGLPTATNTTTSTSTSSTTLYYQSNDKTFNTNNNRIEYMSDDNDDDNTIINVTIPSHHHTNTTKDD